MRDSWRTLKTIYYANTLSWRALKSGTLLFFGFALWAGANVLLSVRPEWLWLRYVAAYGFVLILYGPFHHVVVIPIALKWRRSGGTKTKLGRRLPNISLAVFLSIVLVLGTVPVGPMLFDFGASLEGTSADINPDLLCTKATGDAGTSVHCHLTTSEGIDHVEVQSGGEVLVVDRTPPFEWTIHSENMTEVTNQQQFQVVLRDENGDMIRRYTRTLTMIPEG